jgi:hypothetical protein
VPGEPTHYVACLLEAQVRRRLWAQLRAGRTPEEALAEAGLPASAVLDEEAVLPPDAAVLPEGAPK